MKLTPQPWTGSSFEDIDWSTWQPVERATLLFVVRDEQVLLIHKKRGLGAGKINGPGGRIEEGETPEACAIREVEEEVKVTPTGVSEAGELFFQFVDGHSIHGYVFRANECIGDPQETDEADPFWISIHDIPYDSMWADDRIWMPLMLDRKPFVGRYLFDGDTMLGYTTEAPTTK